MDRPPVASPLIPLWYLHGGTHVRILTNFFKKHFFKNFWALSKGPRGSTSPFSNSPSRATYPQIFPPPLHRDSRFTEAVDTYLQRHPYTNTYYVTSTSSPTSRRVSGLRFLLIFSKNTFSKFFGVLSHGPRGSRPPFSNSPPRATYPRIFSRLSTSIYACGEAVEPNLQRHPYAKTVRPIRGDQPVARPPYKAPILYQALNFTSTVSPSPSTSGA